MDNSRILENLFELLEVSPHASDEVLKGAFRSLNIKYHPDNKKTGNERKLMEISAAYNILTDPKARAQYEEKQRAHIVGSRVGEYEILSVIADGGFGRTYKAKHILVDELVCIKHCHNLEKFDEEILLEEAKIMWDLRHYSVPAIRGLLRMPDDKLALVMSFIPGPTLAQMVEKLSDANARLDPEHVGWITERVLNALRYIHRCGVIHGDLKPHNIIVEHDKHLASIVDFGLAKLKPSAKSGNKGYTEIFSAPEVLAGKTILPESDFYSLGMTMIYALTGDVGRLERKEIPKSTPEPMQRFIRKLIVRDPLARPRWPRDPNEQDLWDEFLQVRRDSFGRGHTNLKPIPGF